MCMYFNKISCGTYSILFESLRKVLVFGQKSVARMNRVNFIFQANVDNGFNVKVGSDRRDICIEEKGLIALVPMLSEAI
jgi:hypothetical protein